MRTPARFLAVIIAIVAAVLVLSGAQMSAQRARPAPPAPAPPPSDRPVPFRVGEVLTYDVTYTGGITVGTATFSVIDRRVTGGTPAYALAGEVKPGWLSQKLYPVHYKADALLDARTLQPLQASIFSNERGREKLKTTVFHGDGSKIDYEVKRTTAVRESRTVLPLSLDPLSAVYVLRGLAFKSGTPVNLTVTSDGNPYRLKVDVTGPEPRKSVVGTVKAWKLTLGVRDGSGKPTTTHQMLLWISDDARRLPLRLEAELSVGWVSLTLAKVSGA